MAKDLGNTAADLRRFVTFMQDLAGAADVLDDYQRLASQADDNAAVVKRAQQSIAEAQAKLATVTAGIADAEAQASAILDAANKQADDIIAAGSDKAAAMAADIAGQGDAIRAAAQADADAIKSQAEATVTMLTMRRVALAEEVADLSNTVDAKRTEAEGLEARLAAAQASIAKLLG